MEIPHREKARFAAHLKQIWLEPDKKSARRAAAVLIEDYEKRFPEAIRCLEEGLEDSLSFYDFPEVEVNAATSGRTRSWDPWIGFTSWWLNRLAEEAYDGPHFANVS